MLLTWSLVYSRLNDLCFLLIGASKHLLVIDTQKDLGLLKGRHLSPRDILTCDLMLGPAPLILYLSNLSSGHVQVPPRECLTPHS